MRTDLEKELQRYFKEIKKCLLCSTKLSRKFLSDLAQSVDQFVEAEPEADITAVKDHFGTPEQIAKSFLAETDIGYLRKKIRIRSIIMICTSIALAAWCIMVGISVVDNHMSAHGHGVEEIIVYEPGEETTDNSDEIFIQGDAA
ncbi:MAG: hypothetical protein IK118_02805 [Clostridia bacterium]|nr:hypothetical protein [Clostridia bacterium]